MYQEYERTLHYSNRTGQMHASGRADGQTCIDCHKGVAHKMPKMPGKPGQEQDFNVQ